MKESQALTLFVTPWALWGRLARKTGEMALASAQVIGYRTSRLALAGSNPGAREQREWALMSREKGEAALESAQAVWVRMLEINQQLAALAMKQMYSTSLTLMSFAASRTPAESVARQATIVRDAVTNAAVAASTLSGATARIARSAVRPVHARISGNARRLGRKSR